MRLGSVHSPALCALTVMAVLSVVGAPLRGQDAGSIRGKVTDQATGRAIASAQVYVEGTSRGTLTDVKGQYVITSAPAGVHQLVARIIGYSPSKKAVTVPSAGAVTVDFSLMQATIELDAVVVTGTAGATTKRALGNSVSHIDAASVVDKGAVQTVDQLLTGRTPGLTLMPGAGTTGTGSNIRIRGAGSLNASNRPIFYVDGVRVTSEVGGAYSVSGQSRNPLDAINPDDIESVEVIKGPAASTLYGAEAASGVIQIITKKGKIGQQRLQWTLKAESGTVAWALPQPNNYKICTTALITGTLYPGCAGLDPNAPEADRLLVDSPLARSGSCAAWITTPNCTSPASLREGNNNGYNLSVRGGGERFSFFSSANTNFERGVFYNNQEDRKGGRINMQVTPSDNVETTVSFGYNITNVRLPLNDNASNGLLRNAYRGEPGRTAPWEPGYLNLGPTQINSVDNVTGDERFLISSVTNFKPYSWFTNRLNLGLDKLNRLAYNFTAIDTTGRAPFGAVSATGVVNRTAAENRQWTVDYSGTVTFDVNSNLSSATSTGLQYNARRYHSVSGTGEGLVANQVNLIGSAAVTRAGEAQTQQNSAGFYLQELMGWKNRLFVTGAVRFDDNSAFGDKFTWATYPKVQASYVISDEPFFRIPQVDELKLRAAFGKAGASPTPFAAERTLGAIAATLPDGTSSTAVQTDAYGNPNLHAESGQEIELGFDASLLRNRVGMEVTYYNKRTKDAIIAIPAPPSSGFVTTTFQNIGEIGNKGLEVGIFGSPINRRNVALDLRLATHFTSNKAIRLGRPPIIFGAFSSVQRQVDGYPLAGYWAVDVKRDADGRPLIDLNGKAILSTDTAYVGPSAPTREMSLASTLTLFGNLRLYAYADYKGGHYLWSAREWWRSYNQNISYEVTHGTLAERAAISSGAERQFIDNADFIKLREVSATYSLPLKWAQLARARSAAFTLSGRNLAIWTKYDLGSDPEVNFDGAVNFTRTDYMSVPMMRRVSASLTLGF